jgi:hypothetical protein
MMVPSFQRDYTTAVKNAIRRTETRRREMAGRGRLDPVALAGRVRQVTGIG